MIILAMLCSATAPVFPSAMVDHNTTPTEWHLDQEHGDHIFLSSVKANTHVRYIDISYDPQSVNHQYLISWFGESPVALIPVTTGPSYSLLLVYSQTTSSDL
ncbi:MAG: hypothetical protein ACOYNS_00750 [Bacteroidota bacterium]